MPELKITKTARRRERMIDAGMDLFLSLGFRGTSMNAIAKRAEVAKPTLYKYFPDKETLFKAGVTRFMGEARELCVYQFSRQGSLAERVAGALAAKHKLFFRLVEHSRYAEELYSQSAQLAAKEFNEFEDWLGSEIAIILKEGRVSSPNSHAQLLMACAYGIAKKAQRVEQIGPAIRLMTQKLLE